MAKKSIKNTANKAVFIIKPKEKIKLAYCKAIKNSTTPFKITFKTPTKKLVRPILKAKKPEDAKGSSHLASQL
ncbi:hypothetical protein KO489_08555 [Reinekea forsetii]|nr:hypothetical protein [Reinekea forsetii]